MNAADIDRLLPHGGNMVLLSAVLDYDDCSIHCLAQSHHDADNPLRMDGRLPVWCGLEYAAQAMAVHQGLCARSSAAPARGFLAVARDLAQAVDELDGLPGDLHIHAEKVIAEGTRSLYRFQLESGGKFLLGGRVAVVLQGGAE